MGEGDFGGPEPTTEKRRVRLTLGEWEKSLSGPGQGTQQSPGVCGRRQRGSGCVSLDLLRGQTWLGGKRTGCGGPKLGRGSIKGVGWKEARKSLA